MSSIVANRHYNDPNMARIAQNLSGLFGPPSASDLAGYAKANALREKAARDAQLFEMARTADSFDQVTFDRMNIANGGYNPSQSYYSVDQGNATQRYGYDTQAATSRANNAADNDRAMMQAILGQATDPVAQGAVRPEPSRRRLSQAELKKVFGKLHETQPTAPDLDAMSWEELKELGRS